MSRRCGASTPRQEADSYRKKEVTMISNGLGTRTDESAATAVIEQIYAAWAAGDAGAFAALFADDATAVLPGVSAPRPTPSRPSPLTAAPPTVPTSCTPCRYSVTTAGVARNVVFQDPQVFRSFALPAVLEGS
jgi:hypothetical protein